MGLLAVLSHPCTGNDYYVKPSEESKCPSGGQPCKTLNEYAENMMDFNGDIRFLFLAGIHSLSTNLTFNQVDSVQMTPAAPGTKVKIQLLYCHMIIKIDSASGFIIKNIDISGIKESVVIARNTQMLSISGVNFYEASVLFRRLWFSNPNPNDIMANVTIQDSVIEQSGQTGIRIINLMLGGAALNLTIVNTSIAHHQQGGMIMETSSTMLITIADSIIEENQLISLENGMSAGAAVGFGIYTTRHDTTVTIRNTHFVRNEDLRGQPIVVYVSGAKAIDVLDSEFRDNRGAAIRAVDIGDRLRLYGNVVFHNNTGQQGGALSLAMLHTPVYFMPGLHVTFENNYAEDVGGAIFVESAPSFYDVNNPNTDSSCFYWFPLLTVNPSADYSISFVNNLARNGGDHVYGTSMMNFCIAAYNTSNGRPIRSKDPHIQQFFHFDDRTISPVSSNPSRICVIDQNTSHSLSPSESCADVDHIFINRTVFPGQIFNISAVLVGAEFGATVGAVYAQFLLDANSQPKLSQNQYWQVVPKPSITQLSYSIFSNASCEVLVLAATGGKTLAISENGRDGIKVIISEYKYDYGVILPSLLTTPIFINLTLSSCPLGFYLEPNSMRCTCNPKLCSAEDTGGTFSNQGTGILYLRDNVWVNAYNNGHVSGVIVHQNCPFDYCNINTDGVDLHDPDTQCTMNHTGILCGKCAPGLSLVLGSNKCLSCSNNNHLALLIFFAAAGFLLVFFIKILNMTVSQGTINGLIFYANIMWAYQSIFFSHDDDKKLWFLKTFIAWLNLDFGIELCFVQGLSAYTKTWLQFVFPFYVWSIAGGMIFIASCSQKMTRLLGNNSVQVLATLFLLCYANLLRSIITALMPATLFVFADNGKPVVNQTQVVWGFDGNLLYGRVPHIFLLVFALLILIFLWLPYTFVFLFIQPLRSGSEHWCLKWVNKYALFLEAYTGPLNGMNQFWVGLLLLVRFVLLLTFTIIYSSSPSTSVLVLVMTIVLLFIVLSYTGQMYNNPTEFKARFLPRKVSFQSILEISCLFNLVVVGGSFLFLDSVTDSSTSAKTSVVYGSIMFAFLQFVGIITYHLYTYVWCCLKSMLKSCKSGSQSWDNSQSAVTMPTTTTVDMNPDMDESLNI